MWKILTAYIGELLIQIYSYVLSHLCLTVIKKVKFLSPIPVCGVFSYNIKQLSNTKLGILQFYSVLTLCTQG